MQRGRLLGAVLGALVASSACSSEADVGATETETETGTGTGTGEPLRPSWHQDVAPIVHARCVGCHREGGIAPFTLADYEAAAPFSELMAAAVLEQTMPPWGAHETETCKPAHAWVDDVRPSEAERETIAEWHALGAPAGDPDDPAPLPAPPSVELGDPSDVFENPTPVVLDDGLDRYVCVSIDPGLGEDAWITGVQMLPDNEAVVHHVLIMLDPTGDSAALAGPDHTYPCDQLELGTLLGSWFPGSGPTELPTDVGVRLPVGARIVLSYHYHPTGSGLDVDQSSVALRWTHEPPAYEALISSVGNAETAATGLLPGPDDPAEGPAFTIPPGARDHTERMRAIVPAWLPSAELFMLGPHMHHVGTQIEIGLERDGEAGCLLHDPRWDFDWQRLYSIDAELGQFPRIEPGDALTLRCTYDNSLDNPAVVEALAEFGLDAPIRVELGAAGLDEMCMAIYGIAVPR